MTFSAEIVNHLTQRDEIITHCVIRRVHFGEHSLEFLGPFELQIEVRSLVQHQLCCDHSVVHPHHRVGEGAELRGEWPERAQGVREGRHLGLQTGKRRQLGPQGVGDRLGRPVAGEDLLPQGCCVSELLVGECLGGVCAQGQFLHGVTDCPNRGTHALDDVAELHTEGLERIDTTGQRAGTHLQVIHPTLGLGEACRLFRGKRPDSRLDGINPRPEGFVLALLLASHHVEDPDLAAVVLLCLGPHGLELGPGGLVLGGDERRSGGDA